MSRTIDYAKCPKCGKEFKMGFGNHWMNDAFGQYSFDRTSHICDGCGCNFEMKIKRQVVFNTTIKKEEVK